MQVMTKEARMIRPTVPQVAALALIVIGSLALLILLYIAALNVSAIIAIVARGTLQG